MDEAKGALYMLNRRLGWTAGEGARTYSCGTGPSYLTASTTFANPCAYTYELSHQAEDCSGFMEAPRQTVSYTTAPEDAVASEIVVKDKDVSPWEALDVINTWVWRHARERLTRFTGR